MEKKGCTRRGSQSRNSVTKKDIGKETNQEIAKLNKQVKNHKLKNIDEDAEGLSNSHRDRFRPLRQGTLRPPRTAGISDS